MKSHSDAQQSRPFRFNYCLDAPEQYAFDQGRAAALQLKTHEINPYTRLREPSQYEAWLDGFRSVAD